MSQTTKSSDDIPAVSTSPRIELFFSSPSQLKERVKMLQSHGYNKFNLVNKNSQDDLLQWCETIREVNPKADICAHYSLKYNKVARKGIDAHLGLLQEFVASSTASANEILLVSGGHNAKNPRPKWNTVEALQGLNDDNLKFAVAYNPYIPDVKRQSEETQRLRQKLETGRVSKVYLQFGTDLLRLKQALESLKGGTELAGSLFLPTKQLIAQQKFRPWNGVHLSADFLSGPEKAHAIVVEILKLYQIYNVEPLWEAPGVRTGKDLDLIAELMVQTHRVVENEQPHNDRMDESSSTEQLIDTSTEALKPTAVSETTNASPAPKKQEQTARPHKTTTTSPASKRQKTLIESGFPASQINPPDPKSTCLLLFGSHDLRLYDNLALQEACKIHATVIPVFLWSPLLITSGGIRAEALEVLLKEAVDNLGRELEAFGLQLIRRNCPQKEDMEREFANILAETNASAVYYNRDFTPHGRDLEIARSNVRKSFFPQVAMEGFQSALPYDVDLVSLTQGFNGGHWGTLMHFLKNCQRNYGQPRRPVPNHETFSLLQKVKPPTAWPVSERNLLLATLPPNSQNWHGGITDAFPDVSYNGAQDLLNIFFKSNTSGYRRYEKERSRADKELATSKLSYHLRIGTLSPNELYWRHEDHPVDSNIFSRRLIWRDLAYYQLRCFPRMSSFPIRSHYQNMEWIEGCEAERRLEAWKRGKTGYPIVDAGMRELWKTGWMTQTVRMVVASFLVEYLRVNWVKGAEWFHYTLVDADSAINAMMWQNAGKSGIDQWNFVLSPESASQDPTGQYTRKWVPELQNLPDELLHRPWQAPPSTLHQYGVVLGQNYPNRVVIDLKGERAKSIESTLQIRRNSQENNNSKGYDIIRLPDGGKTVVFTKKEYRVGKTGKILMVAASDRRRSISRGGGGGRGGTGRRGRK